MKDIKKSENEVTVLGFNAAGWGTLEKVEKKRLGVLDPNVSNPEESGSKVYGFGATPVPDEESIYHRCHIGKEMSEQIVKNFTSRRIFTLNKMYRVFVGSNIQISKPTDVINNFIMNFGFIYNNIRDIYLFAISDTRSMIKD